MKRLLIWLGASLIILVLFGTIYVGLQQVVRRDANTPQIQLAEDAAARLTAGAKPSDLVSGKVDVRHSLADFMIIYDRSGKVLASSADLDGTTPDLPISVLSATNSETYHALTWQPASNVRIALVAVTASEYYVVSGRSLREVENTEDALVQIVGLGAAGALVLAAVIGFLAYDSRLTKTTHTYK
jgi:hypothetical protein